MSTYDLAEPSESDARAALQRVFGALPAQEKWTQACRDARMVPGYVRSTTQLGQVAESLARQGGAAATVARSIQIRLNTYNRVVASASNASVSS